MSDNPQPKSTSDGQEDSASRNIATSEVVRYLGEPQKRINDLVPPIGTMFYSCQSYAVFDFSFRNDERVYWNLDAYIYTTGADPRHADFGRKGGLIHVVLVTSGYVKLDLWDHIVFSIDMKDSGLAPKAQLPSTGSGTQQGDDYRYNINFGEKLQMFKNQGNEAFTFDAKYEESFVLTHAKALGSRAGKIELGIEKIGDPTLHQRVELYGVSVLTHKDPRAFPLSLGCHYETSGRKGNTSWSGEGRANWTFHLGFDT